MRRLLAITLLALALTAGCDEEFVPCATAPAGFDGHIQRWFDSEAEVLKYCTISDANTGDSVACKFLIPVFEPDAFDARNVHHAHIRGGVEFMDPNFYQLHDEWWWFHLLNGAPTDGCPRRPLPGGPRYDTIKQVYAAFANTDYPPLGLQWDNDQKTRLVSVEFYKYMLSICQDKAYWTKNMNTCPRVMAGGTLSYYPAAPGRPVPEAFWAFQIYLDDAVKVWEIERYFERLRQAMPQDMAKTLRWLARAQAPQEAVVDAIRAGGGDLSDRVLKVADVISPGQLTIYNPGVAAGQIRRMGSNDTGTATLGKNDIVVMETVPDDLPPVAAILTGEPQTAQAHLNLLAKARGTPNAFASDTFADEQLIDWQSQGQWLAIRLADGALTWRPMTTEETNAYLALQSGGVITVPWIKDWTKAPDWVDLGAQTPPADLPVKLVGGKSAGFRALFAVPDVPVPHQPLAITVAGYARHIEDLKPTINAMLNNPLFQTSAYTRYILLEGRAEFQTAHDGDEVAAAWLKEWTKDVPKLPNALRGLYNAGGLVQLIRNRPLDATWRTAFRARLTERFGKLSAKQGLRFRSSATVEDIEGFNGAGIYASYSGWLDPVAADKSKKATVERAVVRTWASYWSYGAVSERRAANIDHVSGRMAVLVHPRFPDSVEAANGVILVRLARRADGARRIITEVNVQKGSLSVTNPTRKGAQPEVDHIVQEPGQKPVLQRKQPSSEVPAGTWVLSEGELLKLHTRVVALATAWLDAGNGSLPPAERRLTLQLDLEFRKVLAGWPILASGAKEPARIVYKQARTLMPVFGVSPTDLGGIVAPADLVAAAIRVERRTCKAQGFEFESVDFITAPSANVFEHADKPFVARIRLRLTGGIAGGLPAGTWHQDSHVALASFGHPKFGKAGYRLELSLVDEVAKKWAWYKLVVEQGGDWQLSDDKGKVAGGGGVTCTVVPVKQSVKDWLTSLFDKP